MVLLADPEFKFIWGESPYVPSAISKSDRFGSDRCFSKLRYLRGVLSWIVEQDGSYVLKDANNPASGFRTFFADMRSSWPEHTIPGIPGERDWVHWYETTEVALHVPLPPGDHVRRWASKPYGATGPLRTPVGPDGTTVLEWMRDVEYTNGTVRSVRHTAFPYIYYNTFADYKTLYPGAQDVYLVNPPSHRATEKLKNAYADLYEGFYERIYSTSRGGDGHNSWNSYEYGTTSPDRYFNFQLPTYRIQFFLHYPGSVPSSSDASGPHMMPGSRRLISEAENINALLESISDIVNYPIYECVENGNPDRFSTSFLYRPGWVTDVYGVITDVDQRYPGVRYYNFLYPLMLTWWSTTLGPVGYEVPRGDVTTSDSLTKPFRSEFGFSDVLDPESRRALWNKYKFNETGFVLSDLLDSQQPNDRPGLVLLDTLTYAVGSDFKSEFPSLGNLMLGFSDIVTNAFPKAGKTVPDGTRSFNALDEMYHMTLGSREGVSGRLLSDGPTAAAMALSMLDRTYQLPYVIPVFNVRDCYVSRNRPIEVSVKAGGTVDFHLTKYMGEWVYVPDSKVSGVSGSYSILPGEDNVQTSEAKSAMGCTATSPVRYDLLFNGGAPLSGTRFVSWGVERPIRDVYRANMLDPDEVTWVSSIAPSGVPGIFHGFVESASDPGSRIQIVIGTISPGDIAGADVVTVNISPPSEPSTNGYVIETYKYTETDIESDMPGDILVGPLQGLDVDPDYSWSSRSYATYASSIDESYDEPGKAIQQTNRLMFSVQELDSPCADRSDFRTKAGKYAVSAVQETVRTMKATLIHNNPSDMDAYAPLPSGGRVDSAVVDDDPIPVSYNYYPAELPLEQEVDEDYRYTFSVPMSVERTGGANYRGSMLAERCVSFRVEELVTVYTNGETFVMAYTNEGIAVDNYYAFNRETYDNDYWETVTNSYRSITVTLDEPMNDSYSVTSTVTFDENWVSNVIHETWYDPLYHEYFVNRHTVYEDGGADTYETLVVTNYLHPDFGRPGHGVYNIIRTTVEDKVFHKSDFIDLEEEKIPVREVTPCYRGMTAGGWTSGSPVLVYWGKKGELRTVDIGEDEHPFNISVSAALQVSASLSTPEALLSHTNKLERGSYRAYTGSRQLIRTDWKFSHGTVEPKTD